MSFALTVKEEVISHEFSDEQQKAFLSGFIKQNGELIYSNQNQKLRITTISNRIARSLISFLKKIFSGTTEISVIQSQTLKKNKTFQITLVGPIQQLLQDLFIFDHNNEKLIDLPNEWRDEEHYLRAYVSGVFIASGSVNAPTTSNYHLELQFKSVTEAKYLQEILDAYGFEFKILNRDDKHFVLYLKKALLVSDFLKFIDAPISVMEFENERISRDMVNSINRISNIDISNQSKTLKTAMDQVEQIKYLQKRNQLSKLSEKAQLLAKLRLKKPELSYNELAIELEKQGVILTKSGIAYLFHSIQKLYDQLIGQERADNEK